MKNIWVLRFVISGAIILIAVVYINYQKSNNKRRERDRLVLKNGEPSIGTVTEKYRTGDGQGHQYMPYIQYQFKVNNVTVESQITKVDAEANEEYGLTDAFNIKDGDQFLVLYDTISPKEKSLLCIDKPIHDSLDFIKYIKQIEQNRVKE